MDFVFIAIWAYATGSYGAVIEFILGLLVVLSATLVYFAWKWISWRLPGPRSHVKVR